jgi:hypothetical protein
LRRIAEGGVDLAALDGADVVAVQRPLAAERFLRQRTAGAQLADGAA